MQPVQESVEPPRCNTCQVQLGLADRFCPRCGERVQTGAAPLPTTPVAPENQGKPTPTPNPNPQQEVLQFAPEPDSQPAPQPPQPKCLCGQVLTAEATFCCRCGKRLVAPLLQWRLVPVRSGVSAKPQIVGSSPFIIGKAPDCDLAIAEDEYVSRHHARITRQGDQLQIEDLASSNGSFIRVVRPTGLQEKDEIVIGATILRVERSTEN